VLSGGLAGIQLARNRGKKEMPETMNEAEQLTNPTEQSHGISFQPALLFQKQKARTINQGLI
jgi:acetylornithine/succinyldiaminopimelate/putrescine aminotransferase